MATKQKPSRSSARARTGRGRLAVVPPRRAHTFLGAVTPLPFPGRVLKLGDADASVLAVQRRLNRVGCGPIDEDGVFGPQTAAAVKLFQARFPDVDGQPLKVDGMVGAITWGALFGGPAAGGGAKAAAPLLTEVLKVAAAQIGVMEKPPGSNRGPEVDRYLKAAGLDPEQGSFPWCAAFVYFCFNEAAKVLGRKNPAVRTAGVLDHWHRAGEKGVARITAASAHMHEALIRPGHIFVIDTGDPGGAGHTGLVEAVSAGKLVTIEGNTNDGGGREGIGVFRRGGRRIREINVGFIDYGEG
jgi:hypothetical protein